MAFVRLLRDLMKDKEIGARFVPIAPDEFRTFGMDSMFPTAKIYDPHGQTYEAVDRELLLSYKESEQGQLLHEGISEAGAMGSVTAAGTSYATHGEPMIPVYIFYSMFGFQRTGDFMWAFGDQMGRASSSAPPPAAPRSPARVCSTPTATRSCSRRPTRRAWPTTRRSRSRSRYIVKDGLAADVRLDGAAPAGENVFYYLTVYNEPHVQPAEPENLDVEGVLKGIYRSRRTPGRRTGGRARAQLLASGVGVPWALEAQWMLAEEWGVARRRLVSDVVERAASRGGGVRAAEPPQPRQPAARCRTSPRSSRTHRARSSR